ncbi:unnamed protein product, partial [Allacma fusca]
LKEGENTPCSWKWFSRLSFLREKTYHGNTTDTMVEPNKEANDDGECILHVNTESQARESVTTPKVSIKAAKKRKSSPTLSRSLSGKRNGRHD